MRLFASIVGLLISTASLAQQFEAPLAISPFQLEWMNHETTGTIYSSANYPSSVFVIEAYFKNCPYCNDNAPNIDALRDHYADNDLVQVLDVGRDCRVADYHAWIERHHPNHPVLRDCSQQVLGQLGVRGYPTTYILDCNLNVVARYVGAWDGSTMADVKRQVNQLLDRGCTK
jgi:peroxiredoxin